MNIKRFYAATAREALAKARMTFGEQTVILSNRTTPDGVEVVATAEESLTSLEQQATDPVDHQRAAPAAAPSFKPAAPMRAAAPVRTAAPIAPREPEFDPEHDTVHDDTEQLAMSTLSFQDYVRERMLRRRHEALHGEEDGSDVPHESSSKPAPQQHQHQAHQQASQQQPAAVRRPEPIQVPPQRPAPAVAAPKQASAPSFDMAPERAPVPAPAPMVRAMPQPIATRRPTEPAIAPIKAAAAATIRQETVMEELQSMKDLIEERFNTLSWLGQAKQNPIQSNLMLKLIGAGYSPTLARAVLERLPENFNAGDAVRWLMEVLERNLKTDAETESLPQEGGIYALVGTTGVGKTTTTAKLAAQCARIYGASSVGLITLDTYRIGAHEQLRSYGRMLGVVAHLAHDQAALQDLLGLLSGKKMVLIDTTGVAARDPRKRDMLDVLDLPEIKRLLVVNASSHGDTLDDVFASFKSRGPQQAILSKVDEAVKLGPPLDALIRNRMVLRGVTNGQRVPEDWELADAKKLVSLSMRSTTRSAFEPKVSDLNFFFTRPTASFAQEGAAGHA